jgi:subtilisin family serine protease
MLFVILALISAVYGLVEIQGREDPSCIPGQYMVRYHVNSTLEDVYKHWTEVEATATEVIAKYNINNYYKGFAARMSDEMAESLQNHPLVAEMSLDCIMTAYQQCNSRQDMSPSWGLARVSHYGNINNGMNNHYTTHTGGGANVWVYVLDTGIYVNHPDLRPRASWGANYAGGNNNDGNGHGTHCAGTIAGAAHGIAKSANVIAVKVLSDSGSGSISGIVSGIQWSTSNCNPSAGNRCCMSMSLGGTSGGTMRTAIQAAVNAGIAVIVSAGNSNANACNFFPAAYPECITVGATDAYDYRSSFSNYGTCVDIFAPGTGITSTWYDGSTAVLSGTSMACPHVAGEAAVLLSERAYTPSQLRSELIARGQNNMITSPGTGSPNVLLYNNC